jgi:hypothetical protein
MLLVLLLLMILILLLILIFGTRSVRKPDPHPALKNRVCSAPKARHSETAWGNVLGIHCNVKAPALKSAIHSALDLAGLTASLEARLRRLPLSDRHPGAMPQAWMKVRLWRLPGNGDTSTIRIRSKSKGSAEAALN